MPKGHGPYSRYSGRVATKRSSQDRGSLRQSLMNETAQAFDTNFTIENTAHASKGLTSVEHAARIQALWNSGYSVPGYDPDAQRQAAILDKLTEDIREGSPAAKAAATQELIKKGWHKPAGSTAKSEEPKPFDLPGPEGKKIDTVRNFRKGEDGGPWAFRREELRAPRGSKVRAAFIASQPIEIDDETLPAFKRGWVDPVVRTAAYQSIDPEADLAAYQRGEDVYEIEHGDPHVAEFNANIITAPTYELALISASDMQAAELPTAEELASILHEDGISVVDFGQDREVINRLNSSNPDEFVTIDAAKVRGAVEVRGLTGRLVSMELDGSYSPEDLAGHDGFETLQPKI